MGVRTAWPLTEANGLYRIFCEGMREISAGLYWIMKSILCQVMIVGQEKMSALFKPGLR